jgi:nitroreductase
LLKGGKQKMKKFKIRNSRALMVVLILSLLVSFGNLFGVSKTKSFKFSDANKWEKTGKDTELTKFKGKNALQIKPAKGQGLVLLKDVGFENGVIELDIAAIPRFTGIVFRVKDKDTYEGIYFRPQNSRHENDIKKKRTVQYISHPDYTWSVLRSNSPGKYEAAVDLEPNAWFHVKVVVQGLEARVFVNDAKTPCLVVKDLKMGLSKGAVGVWAGNTSGGTFANFSITPEESIRYTAEQEFLFSTFKNRRSIRKFKSTPVPQEHILKILDMARTAPTSGNQQPWKFLVIQDKKKINQMKEECINSSIERRKKRGITDPKALEETRKRLGEYFGNYLSAPVYVVVLVDSGSKYPSYNTYDGSLAAGYLMIAAKALGYGTVFAQDSIPPEVTKKVLNIPDQFERICITPIGVPEKWPTPKNKKPLTDFIVFEKFVEGENYKKFTKRKAIHLEENILKKYVGTYKINENFQLSITFEKGQLYIQATGQSKVELFPESKTKFFLKVVDAQVTFVEGKDGTFNQLTLHQGGRDVPAMKVTSKK